MKYRDKAASVAGTVWDELTPEERRQAIRLTRRAAHAKRAGKLALKLGASKRAVKAGLRGVSALIDRQKIYLAAARRVKVRATAELAILLFLEAKRLREEGEQDA